MAHFAQLDENNIVLEVIVVNNEVLNNLPFPESEPIGIQFCKDHYGQDTIWKQTSYNNNFRKNYASKGYSYLPEDDAFVCPKPYPSWVLNPETYIWESPIPCPEPWYEYTWDEEKVQWVSRIPVENK